MPHPVRLLPRHRPIRFTVVIVGLALCVATGVSQEASAQSQTAPAAASTWANAMFPSRSHDFGSVARGPLLEHRFAAQNIYGEKVRIAGVRSTCGCTNVQATEKELLPGEKTEIIVLLDTRKAAGHEDATVTVTFDVPFPGEARLRIRSAIRTDLVLEPGVIAFGSVPLGEGAQQKGRLTYTGAGQWQITAIQCGNPAIGLRVKETGRSPGRITYDVLVDLKKDAPAGFFREFAQLVTNDPNPATARVMLVVEGIVAPEVSVHPATLALGRITAGESVSRNLVVQSRRPLQIVAARGPDDRFQCTPPVAARALQIVPVRFRAGGQLGPIGGQVTLQTDYPGFETLTVPVTGQVTPATEGR